MRSTWKPNRRQLLALNNPQSKIIKDPALTKTELIGDPDTNPVDWEYQANSILCIDLEEGCPVWHYTCSLRHHSDGDWVPLSKWNDWMDEWCDKQLRHCIPRFLARVKESEIYSDPTKFSQHVRTKLHAHELQHLKPVLNGVQWDVSRWLQ